jgi:hypothetical protein
MENTVMQRMLEVLLRRLHAATASHPPCPRASHSSGLSASHPALAGWDVLLIGCSHRASSQVELRADKPVDMAALCASPPCSKLHPATSASSGSATPPSRTSLMPTLSPPAYPAYSRCHTFTCGMGSPRHWPPWAVLIYACDWCLSRLL